MVEREYTSHLRASNDADGMVQAGVVDGALDLYAQRGEWDKVLEVASKEGGDSLNRYSVPFMSQYLERGNGSRDRCCRCRRCECCCCCCCLLLVTLYPHVRWFVCLAGQAADIVGMFTRFGVPCIPSQFALFQRMAEQLLSGAFGAVTPDSVLLDAREVLYRATALVKRYVAPTSLFVVNQWH